MPLLNAHRDRKCFSAYMSWRVPLTTFNIKQAPVVQKVDNAIHRINHYPLDIAIGFAISYPVDSDLSGG